MAHPEDATPSQDDLLTEPGSPSETGCGTIEAGQHSAASPLSREAKRAAIQKVVDERRRMIAAERLQLQALKLADPDINIEPTDDDTGSGVRHLCRFAEQRLTAKFGSKC